MTGLVSVDDMLSNAAKAAEAARAGRNTAGMSRVQQLLAGRDDPTDTVELSPVAKLLQQSQTQQASQKSYTEQEWYVNAKVAQLRGQIALYGTLPGLDPSGAMMQSLTDEVNALVSKQQEELRSVQARADEAAKKAKIQEDAAALEKSRPDVETLLARAKSGAKGEYVPTFQAPTTDSAKDKAVEAMLKKIGAKIDTKA